MDVFTYTGNNVEPGDLTGWLPKKNCRIVINFPAGMSEDSIVAIGELIKSKTVSDILLYGAVSFVSSEDDSSLFPRDQYSILVVPTNVATHITNIDNSAFIAHADGTRVIYIMAVDSILSDDTAGAVVIKDGDEISIKVDSIVSIEGADPSDESSDWVIGL